MRLLILTFVTLWCAARTFSQEFHDLELIKFANNKESNHSGERSRTEQVRRSRLRRGLESSPGHLPTADYVFTANDAPAPFITPAWAEKSVSQFPNGTWRCDRPWPEVEMFVPISLHHGQEDTRFNEYETMLLRSMLLFWPLERSNMSLRLVFDEEQIAPKQWVYNTIVDAFNGVKFRFPGGIGFSASPPASHTYRSGHDRQQLMMLWADNYTTAEYVAFADTDCVFLTYVDREDLFEDGKPVINGRSGPAADPFWGMSPSVSHEFSGLEAPMRCMSYFPVIIKRSHLADLRAHIVEHWRNTTHVNRTFDEVFNNVTGWFKPFQFDLMCTYLFHFKRNEYKFYAHPYRVSSDWDGIHPPKDKYETDFSVHKGIPDIFEPKPRIATHARYRHETISRPNDPHLHVIDTLMQQGSCLAPPLVSSGLEGNFSFLHRDRAGCEHLNMARGDDRKGLARGSRNIQKLGYYHEMYTFEDADWNEQTELRQSEKRKKMYEERVDRIKHCNHKLN